MDVLRYRIISCLFLSVWLVDSTELEAIQYTIEIKKKHRARTTSEKMFLNETFGIETRRMQTNWFELLDQPQSENNAIKNTYTQLWIHSPPKNVCVSGVLVCMCVRAPFQCFPIFISLISTDNRYCIASTRCDTQSSNIKVNGIYWIVEADKMLIAHARELRVDTLIVHMANATFGLLLHFSAARQLRTALCYRFALKIIRVRGFFHSIFRIS